MLVNEDIRYPNDKFHIDSNVLSISDPEAYFFLGLSIAAGSLYILNSQKSEISKRKADAMKMNDNQEILI